MKLQGGELKKNERERDVDVVVLTVTGSNSEDRTTTKNPWNIERLVEGASRTSRRAKSNGRSGPGAAPQRFRDLQQERVFQKRRIVHLA